MTHRILVPLDSSDSATRVIPWVDEIATAMQAHVELVYVLERDLDSESVLGEVVFSERFAGQSETDDQPGGVYTSEWEAREQHAGLHLTSARSLFQRTTSISLSVIAGSPAQTIVAHAASSGADLIAMATHGRTGVARAILGSVAGAVVRDSRVPVVVVRNTLTKPARAPHAILVPLDLSKLGEAGLWAILPLAHELNWQIVLFHALELPPQTLPIQGAAIPLGLPPAHLPDEVQAYLEDVAGSLSREGLDVAIRLGRGTAANAVSEAADETGAGIIAMSTHGRSGVSRWLLGSVAEAVVAQASLPVILVRPMELPSSPIEDARG